MSNTNTWQECFLSPVARSVAAPTKPAAILSQLEAVSSWKKTPVPSWL